MIAKFGTPSICVIDDDPNEYKPILDALSRAWVGWIHVLGNERGRLPRKPLSGLRLVFTDLYLTNDSPANAISRTANVFQKVVSTDTGPVVVVIWSKHASDKEPLPGVPEDDQPTQADKFKNLLLLSDKRYLGRLVFVEMQKPSGIRRGKARQAWVKELRKQIDGLLAERKGIEILWAWEALVRNATLQMSGEFSALAQDQQGEATTPEQFDATLQEMFLALTGAHGGFNLEGDNNLRHLVAAMSEALADSIEHSSNSVTELKKRCDWLATKGKRRTDKSFGAKINTILLTAKVTKDDKFLPGMVYRITDNGKAEKSLGVSWETLIRKIVSNLKPESPLPSWTTECVKVLIEISQPCDVQQNHRNVSMLVGGVIVPTDKGKYISSSFGQDPNGANYKLPAKVLLDLSGTGKAASEVFLFLSAHYKWMLKPTRTPSWLKPWFRFREFPSAAIRAWHAAHMARVGFVSI